MHFIVLFTAKYLIVVVCLIAFVYWLTVSKKEKIRLVLFGLLAGVITFALVKTGAALYYDPRPFVSHHVTPIYPHAADNGFPSDHAVLATFVALTILSSSKRLGIALLVLAVLIGISRVVGHIHSPIDIAGSIVFAVIGSVAAMWLTPYVQKRLGVFSKHAPSD